MFYKIFLFLSVALFWMAGFTGPVQAKMYGVHFASYKTENQAQEEIRKMKNLGYEAYAVETDLEDMGVWHRVFTGKYETHKKAIRAAEQLKVKKIIDQYFVRIVPQTKNQGAKAPKTPLKKKERAQSTLPETVVVGNATSKRYHLPWMPYYNKVKKHHRVLFASEEEAIAKGYYRAGTGPDAEKRMKKTPTAKVVSKKKPPEVIVPAQAPEPETARPIEPPRLAAAKNIRDPLKLIDDTRMDKLEFKDPDDLEIVEDESDSALYNQALSEMKKGKYEEALVIFKEFISRDDTDKVWGQRALRHMGDANYFLGKQGRKENLLIAAEFYKNTIQSFPDPRPENALTYYRLARTYEELKYYPESIKQYQNLIAKYPNSPYDAEAYFKIGHLFYVDGKYAQAADSLIVYLMKYRGAARAKESFYLIAHAFYKSRQSANAEIWFRDAQKKWPSLIDVPKGIIMDIGLHKMALRRYDEAISAFSFYANLYPGDEKIREVMLLLAEAYRLEGQYLSALAVYSQIVDKYADQQDAVSAILAMASLGVEKPGVKAFAHMNHLQYYKNPIDAYDTIIMKYPTTPYAEEAMVRKGDALVQRGQKRRAAEIYLEFLNLYPESKLAAEAARGLKSASADLIDEYYAKKDYLAVAYIYFTSFGSVVLQDDEYQQVEKIAKSLKSLGLMDDYQKILSLYLRVAKDDARINQVTVDMAEGLIAQGKFKQAENLLTALMTKPSAKHDAAIQTAVRRNLADISFQTGRYGQAAADYKEVVRSGQAFSEPARVYVNYARALSEQKDNTQALQNYLAALKYFNGEKKQRVNAGIAYKEIGDLYLQASNVAGGIDMYSRSVKSAEDRELKLWSQFLLGQAYLRISRTDDAQNTFDQIRATAGTDVFWGTVLDYYISDKQWWERYGAQINK
ncbi:MAG: tetratricopeptide repeat protein [Smithellaceae bacterium]